MTSLDEWEERNLAAVLKMQVLQGELDQLLERCRCLEIERAVQMLEIEKLTDYRTRLERKISEIQQKCRHERAGSVYDQRTDREIFNCPMCLLHEEVEQSGPRPRRGEFSEVSPSSSTYRIP